MKYTKKTQTPTQLNTNIKKLTGKNGMEYAILIGKQRAQHKNNTKTFNNNNTPT